MTAYYKTEKGVSLRIKVIPKSSRSEIIGFERDYLKLKLLSPPIEGKANDECIKLLAHCFNIPKSHVLITSGQTAKIKTIQIITEQIDSLINKLDKLKYQ